MLGKILLCPALFINIVFWFGSGSESSDGDLFLFKDLFLPQG